MTQNEMILAHMKRHGSISPKEASENYGVMRLGARIYDLKKEGHLIMTRNEKSVNRFGDPIHYARYLYVGEKEVN